MHTAIRARLRGAVLTALLLCWGVPAAGQPTDTQRIDDAIRKRWAEVLKEVAARHGLPVENNHLGGSKEKKPAAYQEIVDTLQGDPTLLALILPDPKSPGLPAAGWRESARRRSELHRAAQENRGERIFGEECE